jgi:site-specific recombinase XerC
MHPEIEQFKDWLTCQYPTSSTRTHYTSDLVLFFSFAKQPSSVITAQTVNKFIAHCLQKGHAHNTINRRLAAINTFYYFLAMTQDQLPVYPVRQRHFLPKTSPLPRDIQDADLERLFIALDNPRDQAMLLIMLDSGLRVGEIHNLSLEDILLEVPPKLKVRGKGDKPRTVYLSPQALSSLQAWLTHRPITNDQAVFISRNKRRLSVCGIQSILRKSCRKTGLNITCHQFRHTFGRRMAEAGMPVTALQTLLGHECLRTTQVYVHLSNQHLHAEYDNAMLSVLEILA